MKFENISYPYKREDFLSSFKSYRQTSEQRRMIDMSNKLADELSENPEYNIITLNNVRTPTYSSLNPTNSVLADYRGEFKK